MYAVLETGSKQYRVSAGDTLQIERLEVEAGKPVTFDRILLVNADGSGAELYDLSKDLAEQTSVAESSVTKRLSAAALNWRRALP